MALVIGLVGGLFILLALTLLRAGFRNPRWIFFWFCMLAALYKYGEGQLETNSENVTLVARYSAACEREHVEVTITNGGTKTITDLGFKFELQLGNRLFKPTPAAISETPLHGQELYTSL